MMDERTCSDYLEAANARDPERLAGSMVRLMPQVQRYLRGVASEKWRSLLRDSRLDIEDVAQEVCARLANVHGKLPTGTSGNPAAVVLMAWCKRVAFNHLVDQKRKVTRPTAGTLMPGAAHDRQDALEGASNRAALEAWAQHGLDDRSASKEDVAALGPMLQACFPKCLPLYERSLALGEEAGREFAASIQLSAENFYQVRTRMKKFMAAFRALEPDPQATDEEVASRMDAALSDDTCRIITKVRQFLVKRKQEGQP